ncbi:MAG TPA: PEP-CTERM sorting domain-containing protein, partial [Lacipirellula sp.]
APSSFLFHVVTDNTSGEHDPAARLRARGERPSVFDISGPNAPAGLGANMNGSPDVYTWRYDGFASGDIIKLQLNSGNAAEQASIAGIMFDPIPEPTSVPLLAAAAIGVISAARRRRT